MKRLKKNVFFLCLYSLAFICSTMPMKQTLIKSRVSKIKTELRKFNVDWSNETKQTWQQQTNALIEQLKKLSARTQATQYRQQVAQKMQKKPTAVTPPAIPLVDNAKQAFKQAHTVLTKDFEQFARANKIVKGNHRINFDRAYRTIIDIYKRVDQKQLTNLDKNELIKAFGAAHLQVVTLQVNYVTIMIRENKVIGKLERINNDIKQPRRPHEILDATLKATDPLDILAQNGQFNLSDFQNVLKQQPAITIQAGCTTLRNQLAENFDELRNQHGKNIKFKEDYKTIAGSYTEILGFLNDHFNQFITGTHKTSFGRDHPIDYTADIEQW